MENTALILIIITNIFLVLILGVLVFLVYKLYQQKTTEKVKTEPEIIPGIHPEAAERLKELKKIAARKASHACPNHPEEPGEINCAVCDRLFCPACAKHFKTMYFCKEHLSTVMSNEWDEILTLKTSTSDPEQGVFLYDAKKHFLEAEEIPTYIETHYKINVDQDHIETYLVLYGIREQNSVLKEKFKKFIS